MKRIVLILALVSIFAIVTLALAEVPKTVTFEAKMGTVTFKHDEHQKRVGETTCTVCHHKSEADGSNAAKCSTCHAKDAVEKDGVKVPKIKDAFHKNCKDCHKKEGKGPTKCKECHIKK